MKISDIGTAALPPTPSRRFGGRSRREDQNAISDGIPGRTEYPGGGRSTRSL